MNKVTFKEAVDKDLGQALLSYMKFKLNKLALFIIAMVGLFLLVVSIFYLISYKVSLVFGINFLFLCSITFILMGGIAMIFENISINKKLREVINGSKGN
jgi:energy-converting hydrogenase Eha subunit C